MTDFGFTNGYKKTNSTKKAGNKSHFFSKITKKFASENKQQNENIQLKNEIFMKSIKKLETNPNLNNLDQFLPYAKVHPYGPH